MSRESRRKRKRPRSPSPSSSSDSEASSSSAAGRAFVDAESPFSTGAAFGAGTPWPHHDDSDDSDAYDPEDLPPPRRGHVRVYRALSDHDEPFRSGIKAAAPRRTSRTVAEHVQGGGRSPFVSLTTSKRKAAKWALKSRRDNRPRIATIDLLASTPAVDFSDPRAARRAKLGRTGENFARSSSEVVVKGPIPKARIRRVESLSTPRSIPADSHSVRTRIATGLKKTSAKPRAVLFTADLPKPSPSKRARKR